MDAYNLDEKDEIDLFAILKRIIDQKRKVIETILIFLVLGLIVILGSPKEYKSEVTLLIESDAKNTSMSGILQQFGGLAGINLNNLNGNNSLTPEIYPDIIKSSPFLIDLLNQKIIYNSDSSQRVWNYINVETRKSLGKLIIEYTIGLPSKVFSILKKEKQKNSLIISTNSAGILRLTKNEYEIIDNLSKRISTKEGEFKNTLRITVFMQDPLIAAQIADSLVRTLTSYIIEYRTQKSKADLNFVEKLHSEAELKFFNAQTNLAVFRDQHQNIILASAKSEEERLQAQYNLAFNVFNGLSQQLEQSKIKVQETTPVFKIIEPAKVPVTKSSPRISIISVLMLFLGLFFGIIRVAFKEIYYRFKNKL
jgi:uncharacterized protein involved in exopolysaccharide biosynthesis